MSLAPLITTRRQYVRPDSSPSYSTSPSIVSGYDNDAVFDDDSYSSTTTSYSPRFLSASIPAPLDFSFTDPSKDDFFVDSRQSTPYDHSAFDPADLQFMTDGSSQNPRLFLQQSTPDASLETYTPPPMSAGSYQSQGWNHNLQNWPHLNPNGAQHHRKIAFRSHKRLSSGSSTASLGPDSPFTQTSDYPHILDTDTQSVNSPHQFENYEQLYTTTEQFAKPLLAPHDPVNDGSLFAPVYSVNPPTDNAAQFIAARNAMGQGVQRARGQRGSNNNTTTTNNNSSSSSNSMGAGAGNAAFPDGPSLQTDFGMSSDVGHRIPGLDRNMSEVYQDELYNPSLTAGQTTTSPLAGSSYHALNQNPHPNQNQSQGQSPSQNPSQGQSQGQSQSQGSHLSPTYRSMVNERLQAADAARSASPASSMTRERSPFRDDSDYAGASDYSQGPNSPAARINSAAQIRARQKLESDAQAFAQHHPQISAQDFAAPKTVSPQETYRDYHESEEESKNFALFPQPELHLTAPEASFPGANVPTGGRRPNTSAALNGPYGTRSDIVDFTSQPSNPTDFSFMASSTMSGIPPQYPFISQSRRQSSSLRTQNPDLLPEFPATLSSMESTKSESGAQEIVRPPGFEPQSQPSSQEESSSSSPPHRPSDTSANTGTYACTAPSCTARFESSLKVQKHRREAHRANSPFAPSGPATVGTPNPTTPSSVTSTNTAATSNTTANGNGHGHGNGTGNAVGVSATSPHSRNAQAAANNVSRNNQPGPHKCERINPSTGKPCNTNFSRSYDLTRHEETIHSNRKQKVRCQLCTETKTFSRNDALTRHMRVVHPDVEFSGKSARRGRH